ncbi:MAG: DinB family protein [Flavobacteriaceae bacterium]|nr:DinB family protein [Flavobacteriaceae bacterium]
MDWNHNIILKNRRLLSKFLEKFSLDQLNTVPKGYRNSIFWNVAHTVVTQQLLVYGLSNRPLLVDSDLVKTYKKDTKTVHEATEEELALVKTLLFSTIEQTKTDYDNGMFKNLTPYTTSLNVTLSTVDEAIRFNTFHEGIHLGYILAMKNTL